MCVKVFVWLLCFGLFGRLFLVLVGSCEWECLCEWWLWWWWWLDGWVLCFFLCFRFFVILLFIELCLLGVVWILMRIFIFFGFEEVVLFLFVIGIFILRVVLLGFFRKGRSGFFEFFMGIFRIIEEWLLWWDRRFWVVYVYCDFTLVFMFFSCFFWVVNFFVCFVRYFFSDILVDGIFLLLFCFWEINVFELFCCKEWLIFISVRFLLVRWFWVGFSLKGGWEDS